MTKRRRGRAAHSRPADGMQRLGQLRFWIEGLVGKGGKHAHGRGTYRGTARECGLRRRLARRRKVRRRIAAESRRRNRPC